LIVENEDKLVVALYVDGLIIAGSNYEMIDEFKRVMKSDFK
jgi:Reverse transcriptase (RNA-dependent DNA polymerase)